MCEIFRSSRGYRPEVDPTQKLEETLKVKALRVQTTFLSVPLLLLLLEVSLLLHLHHLLSRWEN